MVGMSSMSDRYADPGKDLFKTEFWDFIRLLGVRVSTQFSNHF